METNRSLISNLYRIYWYYIIRLIFTTEQNPIMKAYHFSTDQIGLILSSFGIGYGISKLFMGALSDKSNLNRYLATGLIISAILNIFLGSTKNFYLMMFLLLKEWELQLVNELFSFGGVKKTRSYLFHLVISS